MLRISTSRPFSHLIRRPNTNSTVAVASTSATSLGLLFMFRSMLIHNELTEWSPVDVSYIYLAKITAMNMYQDAFTVLVPSIIALILVQRWRFAGVVAHWGLMAPMVLLGAVNVKVASIYGEPATAGLLRFAGLADPRALGTIIGYADPSDLLLICGAGVLLLAAPLTVSIIIRGPVLGKTLVVVFCVVSVIGMVGLAVLTNRNPENVNRRHANAFLHLALSWLTPDPLSARATAGIRTKDPFSEVRSHEAPISYLPAPERKRVVRNVIVIVLESVGSHYLDLVRRPGMTPNLARLLGSSAYFPNTYAHAPSSSMSLFALLSGMYPPVALETMPDMAPELPLPTVVSELTSRGFRTGAFFSAGWDYAGYIAFLRFQGMQAIETANTRKGCAPEDNLGSTAAGTKMAADFTATTDECTASSMLRWINESRQPFMAILWTDQTHYPYRTTDAAELSSAIPETRARYEEAIRATDRMIGEIVAQLRAEGRLDDTLIVVLGDHGEGFGQHGATVHGHQIYDEFLRVPLVLVNDKLFSGALRHDVIGHIDVAPTILDALGIAPPAIWHGRSLFSPTIRERTFFSVPWSTVLMGYRSGTTKVNYEVTSREVEIFNLDVDEGESNNRAASYPSDELREVVAHLWSWKNITDDQYKFLMMKRVRYSTEAE